MFMFLWRVLFLKAVRIITSLQKAHLREHNDQSIFSKSFLIASVWSHGAHTGALGASFFRGVASGLVPLRHSTDPFVAAIVAASTFLLFNRGPSTASLQPHKGCSSCCNTAVAGMHSQGGWPLGHALGWVEHLRLAWLFTLRDARGTTAAFQAITLPCGAGRRVGLGLVHGLGLG